MAIKPLETEEVRDRFDALGRSGGDKSEEFQAFINAEPQRYAKVAKEDNIELQ